MHSFFLECSVFKALSAIISHTKVLLQGITDVLRRLYCSYVDDWKCQTKLPSVHKCTCTYSGQSIPVQVEVMKHFTTIFFPRKLEGTVAIWNIYFYLNIYYYRIKAFGKRHLAILSYLKIIRKIFYNVEM